MDSGRGAFHASVMLAEVLEVLGGIHEGLIVDGTVGLGGHAEALLRHTGPKTRLLACDRDPEALAVARERLAPFADRVTLVHSGYEELPALLAQIGRPAARILLDLGLSSAQLASSRAFSIESDDPLDMRFDATGPDEPARDLLRRLPEAELSRALVEIGPVPSARRLARAWKQAAREGRLETMGDFRRVCHQVLGPRLRRMDSAIVPAMVVRILVNQELERLSRFLDALPQTLERGGVAAVLAYHSAEDGLVKRAFRRLARTGGFRVLYPKGRTPADLEVRRNPRSRSARMRAIRREEAA